MVREGADRVLGLRPFDVQLIGKEAVQGCWGVESAAPRLNNATRNRSSLKKTTPRFGSLSSAGFNWEPCSVPMPRPYAMVA